MSNVVSIKYSKPDNLHIKCTVNGEEMQASVAPYKTLLEMLREDLQLTGTKHGCELGECGTCSVMLDGTLVLSCLTLAIEVEGRHIETVEGIANGANLHPLQSAFADLGGSQCGYCTPGFLTTAKALIESNPIQRGKRLKKLFPETSAAVPAINRFSTQSKKRYAVYRERKQQMRRQDNEQSRKI